MFKIEVQKAADAVTAYRSLIGPTPTAEQSATLAKLIAEAERLSNAWRIAVAVATLIFNGGKDGTYGG